MCFSTMENTVLIVITHEWVIENLPKWEFIGMFTLIFECM